MKKLFILFAGIMLIASCSEINDDAVYNPDQEVLITRTPIVYTPNGNPALAVPMMVNTSNYSVSSPNVLIAPSSGTYNCHAYAFREYGPMSNGLPTYHLEDVKVFFKDGSYITTTAAQAEKVFYCNYSGGVFYESDERFWHSAELVGSGTVISKWNMDGPLVRHGINSRPSTKINEWGQHENVDPWGNQIIYLKKNPYNIDGPDAVSPQGQFNITYTGAAPSVSWVVSSDLQIVSIGSGGLSCTVAATGTNSKAEVKAIFNGDPNLFAIKYVNTVPAVLTLSGNSHVCTSQTYSVNTTAAVTWTVSSGLTLTTQGNTCSVVPKTSTYTGLGWIQAQVGSRTLRKNVTIGNYLPPIICYNEGLFSWSTGWWEKIWIFNSISNRFQFDDTGLDRTVLNEVMEGQRFQFRIVRYYDQTVIYTSPEYSYLNSDFLTPVIFTSQHNVYVLEYRTKCTSTNWHPWRFAAEMHVQNGNDGTGPTGDI